MSDFIEKQGTDLLDDWYYGEADIKEMKEFIRISAKYEQNAYNNSKTK